MTASWPGRKPENPNRSRKRAPAESMGFAGMGAAGLSTLRFSVPLDLTRPSHRREQPSQRFVDELGVGLAFRSFHDRSLERIKRAFLAGFEFRHRLRVRRD